MPSRQITYIYHSLKGARRTTNKDGILNIIDEKYNILGVFDGVSSAIGAKRAVTYSIKFISENHRNFFDNGVFNLSKMMERLSVKLNVTNIKEPYTTYSIAYIPKDSTQHIKLSNLGDSRIYSVTNQYICKLSKDDNDPINSNILTKYLGKRALTKKDFHDIEYHGDETSFLICTDGLYNIMEKSHENLREIYRILNLKKHANIKKGIDKFLKGINTDDASYVFVRCHYV